VAGLDQPLDVGPVGVEALALAIGLEGATDVGALVPGQPEPRQRVEHLLLGVGAKARAVGVLDAQDEAPPCWRTNARLNSDM
jgi:hypothetical protein